VRIPETKYARSGEIAIAYQVHGAGEHDLLLSGSTASNVETIWHLPEAHRLFERLGSFSRVIRYDRRDTGVSDPIRDDLTLEAHVADALAVADAVGVERPVLFGGLDGCRSLAALAATHPERAESLIGVYPTPGGTALESPEGARRVAESLAGLDWPLKLMPYWSPEWNDDPVRQERLARYIRTSATPRQAKRLLQMSLTSDITDVLPSVQCPTLVLLPTGSPEIFPAAPVRRFAELIPGAELREIPGGGGVIYALDVDLIADLVEEFVTGTSPAPPSNRALASVLFTDLVGSTERLAELGDAGWADVLDRHQRAARAAVELHGGRTVKMLGDGVLATFSGPAQAVRCAQRVAHEAEGLGLSVRAGVHTGEIEQVGDDVAGLAVHLTARIMDRAGGGEVLVSRTVRDLVVGSELDFEERGEHELKGIPEPWHLYVAA
jgi:class 3 adenylate cyclase